MCELSAKFVCARASYAKASYVDVHWARLRDEPKKRPRTRSQEAT